MNLRGNLWKINERQLSGWALPFPGADRSIVNRSQYYDATVRKERPVYVETYIRVTSIFWALLLAAWVSTFAVLVMFPLTRKLLQKYPDLCSFYMFKVSLCRSFYLQAFL